MQLSDAIQKLIEAKQKYGDFDLSFEIQQEADPDAPYGHDFVDIQVDKDEEGLYGVFITKTRR